MVKIQLETGYLDVKEGADFPLNFGVAEIRDLTNVRVHSRSRLP
jgi:hypothetical protein